MKHAYLIPGAATVALMSLVWGEVQAQTKIKGCQTLSSPGSYQVTMNLTASSGSCLVVTASGVIIDLNGYQIDGGTTVGAAGVDAGSVPYHVTVRNGTVRGFSSGAGILVTGRAVVEGVHAIANDVGIGVGGGSIVSGNIASENETAGLLVGAGSTIRDNVAANNLGDGIRATGAPGSTLAHNTARLNGGDGLEVECPSVLIGNASTDNTGSELNLIETLGACISADNVAFDSPPL